MNRFLELIFILVIIILISTLASSLKPITENFALGETSDINIISDNLGKTGLAALSSCPSNIIPSFIRLIPSLDDLLNSNFLKPEYTRGLAGINTLTSRTCNDETSKSLVSNMDSNKKDCSVLIDLQPYNLRANSMKLNIISITEDKLVVVPDKNFIDFLLRRPVFFTLETSKAYTIDFNRSTKPFVFTTLPISKVNDMKAFGPTEPIAIPIKTIVSTTSNFFPTQNAYIKDVFARKKANVKSLTNTNMASIDALFNVYYAKRSENFGNSVKLDNGENTKRFSTSPYILSLIDKIKIPKEPLKPENVKNPTISTTFRLNLKNNGGNWVDNWQHLLKIGSEGWGDCDTPGRGILLVAARPRSVRYTDVDGSGFAETSPADLNWACLDFTNVERDTSGTNIINACGGQNRLVLWIPTNIDVDIAYIVSPTMKLAAATWYDQKAKKRQFTFLHKYHTGNRINDVVNTIRTVENLCVSSIAGRALDKSVISVSNVEVSYGMLNLYEWFYSPL